MIGVYRVAAPTVANPLSYECVMTEVIDPQNCNDSQLSLGRMCSVSDVYYGVELVSHFLIQVAAHLYGMETKG